MNGWASISKKDHKYGSEDDNPYDEEDDDEEPGEVYDYFIDDKPQKILTDE